jgi:uncharacterized protein
MPTAPTYPGVYIEEVSSGVRTITGVSTSITAFVGRAAKGPTDQSVQPPITINNFGDFERIFGGLWKESTLGFTVRDFFRNGGSQAIIVRLFHKGAGNDVAKIVVGTLNLKAANPGLWGNALRVRVDHDVSEEVAKRYGLTLGDLFNLLVIDTNTGVLESFRNVTLLESPRKIDQVLEQESTLLRVDGSLPTTVPGPHPDPADPKKAWFADDAASSKVEAAAQADDGDALLGADFLGSEANKTGMHALLKNDLFNILCLPPYNPSNDIDNTVLSEAAILCEQHRAFLIVDSPSGWQNKEQAKTGIDTLSTRSKNAAVFFPRLRQPNPLRDNRLETFASCGVVAGIFARTDSQRGVWKAPAGLEASLVGVPELAVSLTDAENGELNPKGLNCLRIQPGAGPVIWGSRTLQGNDRLASEWKYIPVRRTALFLEESLYRGMQWVVFEPNDEPLWAQIRLNVGAFMHNLFRQGAFQGKTPREAYLVKCDRETTTQNDINLGIVNVVVGFAPLKPAEFVIIKLQQLAGQIEV